MKNFYSYDFLKHWAEVLIRIGDWSTNNSYLQHTKKVVDNTKTGPKVSSCRQILSSARQRQLWLFFPFQMMFVTKNQNFFFRMEDTLGANNWNNFFFHSQLFMKFYSFFSFLHQIHNHIKRWEWKKGRTFFAFLNSH